MIPSTSYPIQRHGHGQSIPVLDLWIDAAFALPFESLEPGETVAHSERVVVRMMKGGRHSYAFARLRRGNWKIDGHTASSSDAWNEHVTHWLPLVEPLGVE